MSVLPDDLYPRPVGRVDAADDSITRFVVLHYRYDPERNERRDVVLAAFDDADEFEEFFALLQGNLQRRQERQQPGDSIDQRERVSGVVLKPGQTQR